MYGEEMILKAREVEIIRQKKFGKEKKMKGKSFVLFLAGKCKEKFLEMF